MTNTRLPKTKLSCERTPEVVKGVYTVKNLMKVQDNRSAFPRQHNRFSQ